MKKFLVTLVAFLGLGACLNGCIPAAVAVYGVSRHRTHKSYNEYVADTTKTNQERQSQRLEPCPVLSFDDWKKNRKNLPQPGQESTPAPAPGK